MEKIILNVEGMSCSHCVSAVTKALTDLGGVGAVMVDLEGKKVTVDYDPAIATVEAMKEAIEDQGYDVL